MTAFMLQAPLESGSTAEVFLVKLDNAHKERQFGRYRGHHRPNGMTKLPNCFLLVPMNRASTIDEIPLLELAIRYIAVNQVNSDSFVECNGVLVVTVN